MGAPERVPGYGRVYPYEATACKFLLGGIGTGNVSVGTRGNLCDWEIFGKPGKGNRLPWTFFAIWAKGRQSGTQDTRVLESRLYPPHTRPAGYQAHEAAGMRRFERSSIRGCTPFVEVKLEDDTFPLCVSLEAFTPFIPLNAKDSGFPGGVLRYRVKNGTDEPFDVTVAGSLANAVGFDGYDLFDYMRLKAPVRNTYRETETVKGLFFTSDELPADDLTSGSMALLTRAENEVTVKESWLRGPWWDGVHDFWDDFSDDGRLSFHSEFQGRESLFHWVPHNRYGSLGVCRTVPPGEEAVFEFALMWYFPNRPQGWEGHAAGYHPSHGVARHYFSTLWPDAFAAGEDLFCRLPELERLSRAFTQALYESTLPEPVIEALSNNLTVLRSPTCFRLEDGTFLSWEGCFDQRGSCEGNCTHVWNYAQSAAFLFPELEQSMRRTEFLLETDDDGRMAFRTLQVFGDEKWDMDPAADGQMGCILRLYRDWKLSGDDDLLQKLWPRASAALDFAFRYWDSDGDGVLDARQHNTYDIEFYGPNSLCNSLFLAALKAGEQMAAAVGDKAHAVKYKEAFEQGSRRTDELLWGGEYYVQRLDDPDSYRYQYGEGCLSDQVFGQLVAHVCGLGYVLPQEHVKQAVRSVFRYNFRERLADHQNVQRTYGLNDEAGLLLCSWPHGGRPRLPFVYSDEVWTGIEYQVAAHLMYEGYIEEGLRLVEAVRGRYDGFARNPWDEIECGHHYVRSLASWSLLLALSGYEYDLTKHQIAFQPRINQEDFRCFFSNATQWGIYSQKRDPRTGEWDRRVQVLYTVPDSSKSIVQDENSGIQKVKK